MVGFILLNYESAHDLKICVESIKRVTKIKYQIYIVDNASKDNSIDLIRDWYLNDKDVSIIVSKANNGYSAGNNLGIKKAIKDGADKLIILNPDVILENDIAFILSDRLDKNNDVGVAIPYIVDAHGRYGQFFRKRYTFPKALVERKPFLYLTRVKKEWSLYRNDYDMNTEFKFDGSGSGCCFMVKSSVMEDINYFDEGLFLYYEEYVLGIKLQDKGLQTLYVPQARIIHNHIDSKRYCSAHTNYYRYISSLYVLNKYEKCAKWKLKFLLMENTFLLFFRGLRHKDYWHTIKKYYKNANKLIK